MNDDQFNELLSYVMLTAVNSTQPLFQQNLQTSLTPEQVDHCQEYTLRHAARLKATLAARNPLHETALPVFAVPTSGQADV